MITDQGFPLITLAGRALVDRAQTVDLELLASIPQHLMPTEAIV